MIRDRPTVVGTPKDRIVAAAAGLLAQGGREAVSTRAVSAAAGVQAPTIYRLFGDKRGLLDAVATHGFMAYLATKADLAPRADPIEDFRAGWDLHVGFGLANPALYALIHGEPRPGASPSAVIAVDVIARKVRRIAEAGRLGVGEERAVQLVFAVGSGTTLALIGLPEDRRDPALSDLAREAVIAAITTETPAMATPGPAGAAIALRAVLPEVTALTDQERGLLREWLDRIVNS